MPRPIKIKIDVSKIDKAGLYKGTKGTYLDCVAWPSKTPGQYGDTHYIVQELSKEKRDAGDKGAIIGNMTVPDDEPPQRQQSRGRETAKRETMDEVFTDDDSSEIPF
jgi:hypothetical protein